MQRSWMWSQDTDKYSTKFQFKKFSDFSVKRTIADALLFIQIDILQRLAYIGSVWNYDIWDIHVYRIFFLVVDITLLCRTVISTRYLAFSFRAKQMGYVWNNYAFCISKYLLPSTKLPHIRESSTVVSCRVPSRKLCCETWYGQTVTFAVRLHSYAWSRPKEC
jgi:hypothetical protein